MYSYSHFFSGDEVAQPFIERNTEEILNYFSSTLHTLMVKI